MENVFSEWYPKSKKEALKESKQFSITVEVMRSLEDLNKILMIRGDGEEWTEDAWKIKNKFKDNFHTLFTSDTETSYEAL